MLLRQGVDQPLEVRSEDITVIGLDKAQALVVSDKMRVLRLRNDGDALESLRSSFDDTVLQERLPDTLLPVVRVDRQGIQVVLSGIRLRVGCGVLSEESGPLLPEGLIAKLQVQLSRVGEKSPCGDSIDLRKPCVLPGVKRVLPALAFGETLKEVRHAVREKTLEVIKVHPGEDTLGEERGVGWLCVTDGEHRLFLVEVLVDDDECVRHQAGMLFGLNEESVFCHGTACFT